MGTRQVDDWLEDCGCVILQSFGRSNLINNGIAIVWFKKQLMPWNFACSSNNKRFKLFIVEILQFYVTIFDQWPSGSSFCHVNNGVQFNLGWVKLKTIKRVRYSIQSCVLAWHSYIEKSSVKTRSTIMCGKKMAAWLKKQKVLILWLCTGQGILVLVNK